MALLDVINKDLMNAMKQKDEAALRAIRSIKSALLLLRTEEGMEEISAEAEIKLLQKLVKQRRDAIEIYQKQNRQDLVKTEQEEMDIISKYLPEQLTNEQLVPILQKIMAESGMASMADFGKLMAMAQKHLAGKADGKLIAETLKILLSAK